MQTTSTFEMKKIILNRKNLQNIIPFLKKKNIETAQQ
jgi:hypothetical protein